jgi:hypothetical protein
MVNYSKFSCHFIIAYFITRHGQNITKIVILGVEHVNAFQYLSTGNRQPPISKASNNGTLKHKCLNLKHQMTDSFFAGTLITYLFCQPREYSEITDSSNRSCNVFAG